MPLLENFISLLSSDPPKWLSTFLKPHTILLLILFLIIIFNRTPIKPKVVTLLVLGDIGRSPRIMYHAESYLKKGYTVWIIGYAGTELSSALREGMRQPAEGLSVKKEDWKNGVKKVNVKYIKETPGWLRWLPFVIGGPIKVLWQCVGVLYLLLSFPSDGGPEILMVQNPPSIPTLPLALLSSSLRSSLLIIDWHNLGHTILSLKLGPSSLLVGTSKTIERIFGRKAGVHVFVTEGMGRWLSREWGLIGEKVVLHDRPPERFRRSKLKEIHELFLRIESTLRPSLPPRPASEWDSEKTSPAPPLPQTLLTSLNPDTHSITYKTDRPALLISSTSWTADEDFNVLIAALDAYEVVARQREWDLRKPLSKEEEKGQVDETVKDGLPDLLVLISGKGPMKRDFEKQIALREATNSTSSSNRFIWKHIILRTVWLETDDYPIFLGSADLGISLHQSSSGLDLPMKVVDMFGCGVPVLSRDFECVSELVKEGQNGRIFSTAEQLANHLIDILGEGFPSNAPKLDKLQSFFSQPTANQDGSVSRGWDSWSENWEKNLWPVIVKAREGGRGEEGRMESVVMSGSEENAQQSRKDR